MEKSQSINSLGTEKIGRLLARFAIPGIASLVVNALYNIVDQIFIGQGVGYLGNGATNVIFPITTFAMAFSLMIGDGTASFLSLMLGKKEFKKAAQGTAAGLIFTVIAGILIAAVVLVFLKPLCILFGATDAILPYAIQYGGISAIGIPFSCICSSYASIIRADGSPKYNMVGLLVGCALNLIGDPIFIFVFHWGVAGAAWATIIGQIANAFINIAYIKRIKSVKLTKEDAKGCLSNVPSVLKLGISSFISQMVLVVVMAVQNNVLRFYGAQSQYGADIPISALGITMKVFNILMVIVIGLASGAQPIWGYNYGARQYKRVKHTFFLVASISFVVMMFAFVLFQFFPMAIVSIFGTADEMYNLFAQKTLRIFLLLVPISCIPLVSGIFFQSVGRPILASIISLSKQIIFMIPAILILSPRIGVEGVLWSGPVADLLSFILAVLLLVFSWKSIFNEKASVANKDYSQEDEKVSESESFAKNIHTEENAEKTFIITIGRTCGSGGRRIGKEIAKRLGVPFYDNELIQEAADESGLSAMFLAFADEKIVSINAVQNTVHNVGVTSDELKKLHKAASDAQAAAIEKLAKNNSCVIVGRRADKILKDRPNLLRIFITASIKNRVENISKARHCSKEEAEKFIKTVDKQRRLYYGEDWGIGNNYDICLAVDKLGFENAVNIIENTIKKIANLQ